MRKEIVRFQDEIERFREEDKGRRQWKKLGSIDSLVSADSDYSSGIMSRKVDKQSLANPDVSMLQSSQTPKMKKKHVQISPEPADVIKTPEQKLTRSSSSSLEKEPKKQLVQVVSRKDVDESGHSDDSLATLPSVKELASKFMQTRSPEPIPRKSVQKQVN